MSNLPDDPDWTEILAHWRLVNSDKAPITIKEYKIELQAFKSFVRAISWPHQRSSWFVEERPDDGYVFSIYDQEDQKSELVCRVRRWWFDQVRRQAWDMVLIHLNLEMDRLRTMVGWENA